MRFFDYVKVAFRNLRRQKLRSFLTIIAVVIGATSVVSLLSLVLGASQVIVTQLEQVGAFNLVTVMANQISLQDSGPFGGGGEVEETSDKKLTDETIKMLKAIPHVVSASPQVQTWGIESIKLEGSEKSYRINQITAYEPSKENDKTLVAGRNFTKNDKKGVIILSPNYLKRLGYEESRASEIIGKRVILTTYKGYRGEGADLPGPNARQEEYKALDNKTTEFKAEVVGVVSPGGQDGMSSFIPMVWARGLMTNQWWEEDSEARKKMEESGQPFNTNSMKLHVEDMIAKNGYSTIVVKVDESKNAESVAEEVKKLNLGAITAKDFLDQIMQLFTALGVVLGAIGAISLGVATIGIVNTMIMATYERTREIGVMRACGATKGTVRALFTFEAALLGFFGGAFGVLLGYGLAYGANYFGSSMLSDQGITVDSITAIPWWLSFGVVGFTTLLGLLSGLYPAFKASRLNPVDALRFE